MTAGEQTVGAKRVRVVVISDIHATEQGDPPTHVAVSTSGDPQANALIAARRFLKKEIIDADVVVCPGDLVHEGCTDPMQWVWRELRGLAADLGAALVASAGNHDLLLSARAPARPYDSLRALEEFPAQGPHHAVNYWANDLADVDGGHWRVLSINSCADMAFDDNASGHGWLSRHCQRALRTHLAPHSAEVNICVVHHHPREWTEHSLRDGNDLTAAESNHMREGDCLIEMLEARPERWFLIHGHRHSPRLDYVGHGTSGPTRLSSGSLGADLLGEHGTLVRNQMHIVDFHVEKAAALGLPLVGEVQSFEWTTGHGWAESSAEPLAARTGFGFRRDGAELAVSFRLHARAERQRTWTFEQLEAHEPRFRYLSAFDRERFFDAVVALGGGVAISTGEVVFP